MATRNQETGLYEARRLFASTGQEFVGVGDTKELAAKALKAQLAELEVDYKKDVDAALEVAREGIRNQASEKRKQAEANFSKRLSEADALQSPEREVAFEIIEKKRSRRFAAIDQKELELLDRAEKKAKDDLRAITIAVARGGMPKRKLSLEPTSRNFRSCGFAVTRDEEGKVKYEYSSDRQVSTLARPDLAAEIRKGLDKKLNEPT